MGVDFLGSNGFNGTPAEKWAQWVRCTHKNYKCESKKGCHPIHGYNFVNS